MIRPYGLRGLLVDTPSPLGLAAAARELEGVVDVVPGAASVLVLCASEGDVRRVAPVVGRTSAVSGHGEIASKLHVVTIPVVYDGADLSLVAEHLGVSEAEVVSRHTAGTYVVALMGFAPGFGYLSGLDPSLHLPRRDEPRASVPAGSVAIAGEWTGCYPRSSPGGWHLLGRTAAPLWDLAREQPALLRPGMRVRFEAVT